MAIICVSSDATRIQEQVAPCMATPTGDHGHSVLGPSLHPGPGATALGWFYFCTWHIKYPEMYSFAILQAGPLKWRCGWGWSFLEVLRKGVSQTPVPASGASWRSLACPRMPSAHFDECPLCVMHQSPGHSSLQKISQVLLTICTKGGIKEHPPRCCPPDV